MEFHRPQNAWWLCTGCADVCATAASLLQVVSLAQLGHAGHQLDMLVSGDSFELPGQENTTLTLILFLLLLLPPFLLESLSPQLLWSGMLEMWKPCLLPEKKSSVCVEWMEPHPYMVKSMVQEGPKTREWHMSKAYPITNENLLFVQTYKPSTD